LKHPSFWTRIILTDETLIVSRFQKRRRPSPQGRDRCLRAWTGNV